MKKQIQFVLFGLSFMSFLTINANAYLDPGIGSAILQGILTVLLFVSTTVGIFWRNIKKFFDKRRKDDNK